ncbi:hypothetical protein BST81_22165 [Leptolyngbya sp. 'hensonii']|uniref:hypothetical protein n=1 Tax=Leptolyngbya sp. 'hensonii' TaxID=1922337 RepID=UPI00094FC83D|nr:hypothetical protein [Leptolyngbya sp. 'hensonii']OLP16303.1 hypothetical protein BST81_22165 [Leptolyngbya sp. 'hensonii']
MAGLKNVIVAAVGWFEVALVAVSCRLAADMMTIIQPMGYPLAYRAERRWTQHLCNQSGSQFKFV